MSPGEKLKYNVGIAAYGLLRSECYIEKRGAGCSCSRLKLRYIIEKKGGGGEKKCLHTYTTHNPLGAPIPVYIDRIPFIFLSPRKPAAS